MLRSSGREAGGGCFLPLAPLLPFPLLDVFFFVDAFFEVVFFDVAFFGDDFVDFFDLAVEFAFDFVLAVNWFPIYLSTCTNENCLKNACMHDADAK